MKELLFLISLLALPWALWAQEDSLKRDTTVLLNEVDVKGTRVVTRSDGLLYLPSEQQKLASANGYALLNKLSLPMIRVNEVGHSLSAVNGRGLEVRVNGTLASKADLLSLDPKLVRGVEFTDDPGVRYTSEVGYVINIRMRRGDEGLALGTELSNAVTHPEGDDMAYARWNRRNSELGLAYDFGYSDDRHSRYREDADYLLNDGTHHLITREDLARRSRSFSNNIQLKYSLADSASYVFQATLSGDFQHSPTGLTERRVAEAGSGCAMAALRRNGKRFSPVLDLYFCHALGSHQTLTANVVGTSIASDEHSSNTEGAPYAYRVDGDTWSLTSEAIYENRLKPFTWSAGVNHQWKYTRNIYTGDAAATNHMHHSNLYLFSQVKGQWKRLNYSAGLGVSNASYRQGRADFNNWLLRPKATLAWQVAEALSLTYGFEVSQRISQIAMVSDTRLRTNAMEWTVGNPDIRPTQVVTHRIALSYAKPRLYSQLHVEWRKNRHTNMASYERTADDQFLYRQKNQPHINMLYAASHTSWTVMPERLTATLGGVVARFFNGGDDYNHCLTTCFANGSLQAYLGRWTMTAQLDTGWKFMEGESIGHQEANNALQCSYRVGNCQLALTWRHPLEPRPRVTAARLVNRYIHKSMRVLSDDSGNSLTLNFSWKLNLGRRYRDIPRTMRNRDTQTGIL